MNFVFVTHAPRDPLSAVFRYYFERKSWLEEKGHHVEILTPADLPATSARASRWWPFTFPREVAARFERNQAAAPDLAIFHSFAGWATACRKGRSAPLRRLRIVTQFHGLEPLYHRAIRREMNRAGRPFRLRFRLMAEIVMPRLLSAACRRSDLVLCLNRAERDEILRRRWSTAEKLRVFPVQVEANFFFPHSPRPRANRLLFLGQWLEGKGTRYLVAAFSALAREHPDLVLYCVGTRVQSDRVLADFPQKLRPRIQVVPEISREDLIGVFEASDLFVFPSLSEGFGLALLEAMAAGLPIVCAPVGAAPDLLEHGRSAVFVEPAASEPLVDAIGALLDDRKKRRSLGEAAARVAWDYRTERWKPRFVELMETTAAGPGP